MKNKPVLDQARVEFQLAGYGVAPVTAVSDPSLHPRVQEYRRLVGSRMSPLDKQGNQTKVPQAPYHVSRKIDGEFTVLIYRDGEAFTMNPGGTVRVGMPWMEEALRRLAEAGVKEALIAGELYAERVGDGRARVHDVTTVSRSPESTDDLNRLRFAVFDLISLDSAGPDECFADTWQKIEKLFAGGQGIHPVEAAEANTLEDVEKLFHQWVETEGSEGIVLRSDTAGKFKVKPRHTLDVTVVGFTESADDREGLLHDLLVAVMRQDGTLHVLTRVGGGFSDDQRREMLGELKDMTVESEYAEVNSDHVAYQMVRPDWVVEISCVDLVSQTTTCGPVNRMVLDWNVDRSESYHIVRRMPLASVISPQFIRRREDKTVCVEDVRIRQITDLVEVPLADRDARDVKLPKSEVLRREVYTKQLKGETMVRKFVMWKTNKEESDEFPAYVVHYTDFSPNRKAPLARDIRVSSSREQIDLLWDGLIMANIKKGWNPYEPVEETETAPAADKPPEVTKAAAESKPAKQKAAIKKKAAAKKEAAEKPPEVAAVQTKKKAAVKKKVPAKKAPAKKKAAAEKEAPAEKKVAKKKATKKKAAKKKSD